MLLYELFDNNILDVKQVKTVKDLLMFFKMKGIKSIPTTSFIRELANRGILIDIPGLIKHLENMPIIIDANEQTIKLVNAEDTEFKSDEKVDLNKERVSQMAKSSMLRGRNK